MAPFNSGMPPWKAILTEGRRWKVLACRRTFGGNWLSAFEVGRVSRLGLERCAAI
jgi:hypothetical protein